MIIIMASDGFSLSWMVFQIFFFMLRILGGHTNRKNIIGDLYCFLITLIKFDKLMSHRMYVCLTFCNIFTIGYFNCFS